MLAFASLARTRMLSYLFTIVNENEPNMDSFTYLEDSFCMIIAEFE